MKMELEYQTSTLSTMTDPIIIIENDQYYQNDQYYSNEQYISNEQYYQNGQYYQSECPSNELYFQSEFYPNDQYFHQNTQWILENLCNGYQSEYEFQLKDMQTFLQNGNLFESEQLYSMNNEIAPIDSNYNQLFLHYGKIK